MLKGISWEHLILTDKRGKFSIKHLGEICKKFPLVQYQDIDNWNCQIVPYIGKNEAHRCDVID